MFTFGEEGTPRRLKENFLLPLFILAFVGRFEEGGDMMKFFKEMF
jgi:hypothetical protein